MSDINVVVVSGNLTREPELRHTPSDTAVLSFGIAFNEYAVDKQTGQGSDRPNFADVVAFGRRAEGLAKCLRKGMKVTISGRLRYETWERDGQKRSKLSIVADEVSLPPRSSQDQNVAQTASGGPTGAYPRQPLGEVYQASPEQQAYITQMFQSAAASYDPYEEVPF